MITRQITYYVLGNRWQLIKTSRKSKGNVSIHWTYWFFTPHSFAKWSRWQAGVCHYPAREGEARVMTVDSRSPALWQESQGSGAGPARTVFTGREDKAVFKCHLRLEITGSGRKRAAGQEWILSQKTKQVQQKFKQSGKKLKYANNVEMDKNELIWWVWSVWRCFFRLERHPIFLS